MQRLLRIAVPLVALISCGPSSRGNGAGGGGNGADGGGGGNGGDGGNGTCVAQAEVCDDGIDNDCDGKTDCSDPDCSGVGNCPVCGMVDVPTGQPFFLPDGVGENEATGMWPACSTDAQCNGVSSGSTEMPNCIQKGCHASYTSTLHFIGFGSGATFSQVGDIQSICVNMEHSWLRDMQIEMIAPNGNIIVLQKMLGQMGGEIYLGHPVDDDEDNPMPGVGSDYCWTPTATNGDMLDYANGGGAMDTYSFGGEPHDELPPGNYSAAAPWTSLMGAPLNGDWTLRVTDLWPEDNGYVFKWTIAFNPDLVSDCSGPILGLQ